jgi:DNA-binding protein HU-beta
MSFNNEKKGIDGMIWVGKSYKKIFCEREETCAIPFKPKKSPHCYVHEAEWRGCCRKIPTMNNWLIPGKSKIFLAHKDNLKPRERGRIFGYFVLERFEIIITCPCKEGQEITRKCWDDSEIVTHRCENGRWVSTGEKCPSFNGDEDEPEPEPVCLDDSMFEEDRACEVKIKQEDTPVNLKLFESEEYCNRRLIPGSIYAVDALNAKITDHFTKELEKLHFKQDFDQAENDEKKKDYIRQGAEVFKEVVETIKKGWKPKTAIPDILKGKAVLQGELVLFKTPQPILERFDQAAFRGILRLDGDDLIDQIAEGVRIPKIHYFFDSPTEKLLATMSQELRINKAFAKRILNTLYEIAKNELKECRPFKLPGFGTFSIVQRKATTGINPRTKEPIQIPAKKVVKFKPFKNIREEMKKIKCP